MFIFRFSILEFRQRVKIIVFRFHHIINYDIVLQLTYTFRNFFSNNFVEGSMQFAKLNNTHVEAHVRSYRANGLSLRWKALQSPAPTESYFIPQKRVPTPFTLCSTFLRGPTEREEKRGSWSFVPKWSSSGPNLVLVPRSRKSRWLVTSEGGSKKRREIGPRYRRT